MPPKLCAMKFQGTKAELERRIDFVDVHLRDVPHGQTVRTGDGPERRLTMRETFAHILEYLDRIDPDSIVRVDHGRARWRSSVAGSMRATRRIPSAAWAKGGAAGSAVPACGGTFEARRDEDFRLVRKRVARFRIEAESR